MDLNYFLLSNSFWALVTLGLATGVVLALALNLYNLYEFSAFIDCAYIVELMIVDLASSAAYGYPEYASACIATADRTPPIPARFALRLAFGSI